MTQTARMVPVIATALAWLLAAGPAPALTVDQVIALKKAGVGEKTIQAMIQAEEAVKARGGSGRYVQRQFGGREWIVYEASSSRGVEEYPLHLGPAQPEQAGQVGRIGDIVQAGPSPPVPAATPGPAPAPGYTLLIARHNERPPAEEQAKLLVAYGLLARLLPVQEPGQGKRYYVLVGAYPDQEEARVQGERLRREGAIGEFSVISQ